MPKYFSAEIIKKVMQPNKKYNDGSHTDSVTTTFFSK